MSAPAVDASKEVKGRRKLLMQKQQANATESPSTGKLFEKVTRRSRNYKIPFFEKSLAGLIGKQDGMNVARNDDRVFETIILDNKLEVMLVHDKDPKATHGGVALSVNVGYFSDPDTMPGLAHLTEHMMFLGGNERFMPGEFDRFVSNTGGNKNAYTVAEETNYHFDVPYSQALYEAAIDRFTSSFVNPTFTQDGIEKEAEVVGNEHSKNIGDPMRSILELLRVTSNPEHPFVKFSCGNFESLVDTPKKMNVDVTESLLEFFNRHYSANRMKAVLHAPASIETLKIIARKYFTKIINNNSIPIAIKTYPFTQVENFRKFHVISNEEENELIVSFPLENFSNLRTDLMHVYFGEALRRNAPGTLADYLEEKDWATGISAFPMQCSNDVTLFWIAFTCTENGIWDNVDDILHALFNYIDRIYRGGLPEDFISDVAENVAKAYTQRLNKHPYSFSQETVSQMNLTRKEHYLTYGKVPYSFDNETFLRFCESLHPSKMTLLISHKGAEAVADQQEERLKARYAIEQMNGDQLEYFLQMDSEMNFVLPKVDVEKKMEQFRFRKFMPPKYLNKSAALKLCGNLPRSLAESPIMEAKYQAFVYLKPPRDEDYDAEGVVVKEKADENTGLDESLEDKKDKVDPKVQRMLKFQGHIGESQQPMAMTKIPMLDKDDITASQVGTTDVIDPEVHTLPDELIYSKKKIKKIVTLPSIKKQRKADLENKYLASIYDFRNFDHVFNKFYMPCDCHNPDLDDGIGTIDKEKKKKKSESEDGTTSFAKRGVINSGNNSPKKKVDMNNNKVAGLNDGSAGNDVELDKNDDAVGKLVDLDCKVFFKPPVSDQLRPPLLIKATDKGLLFYKQNVPLTKETFSTQLCVTALVHQPYLNDFQGTGIEKLLLGFYTNFAGNSVGKYAKQLKFDNHIDIEIFPNSNSLVLEVTGYDETVFQVCQQIFDEMKKTYEFKWERFDRFKTAMLGSIKELKKKPLSVCEANIGFLLSDPSITYSDREKQIKSLKLREVQNFVKRPFENCNLQVLVVGNALQDEAIKMYELLENSLKRSDGNKEMHASFPKSVTLDLEIRREVFYVQQTKDIFNDNIFDFQANNEDNNSGYHCHFQVQDMTPKGRALIALLGTVIETPCFRYIRTEQRVGYLVHSRAKAFGLAGAFEFIFQSNNIGPYSMDEKLEAFLTIYEEELPKLTVQELFKAKRGLAAHFVKPPKNTAAEADHWGGYIASGRYDFDVLPKITNELWKLTVDDLVQFYQQVLAPSAPLRRKIVCGVLCGQHTPDDEFIREEKAKDPNVIIVQDPYSFKYSRPLLS